jgi:Tfp pilus assembly protein PilX
MRNSRGQIVIGAIVLIVVLALLVPALVFYVQNETKWTLKEQRTTRAFQLAESAVERGFQEVITSTNNWAQIQSGTPITDYNFDRTYSDINGGSYQIRIQQGPGTQAATITGVGKDTSSNEVRAVSAVYGNSASNAAIYAVGGIDLHSNPDVEWGAVMSPNTIVTDHTHPRFYSAGSVSLDTNNATPPNTDGIQWWSYYPYLPPQPQIDTESYKQIAIATGHYYGACPCSVSLGSVAGTYYFNGDTTFQSSNPKNFVTGNVIVMGDFTLQGNSSAQAGSLAATLPTTAWREYGATSAEWATYRAWDIGAAGTFPGQNSSYAPGAVTVNLSNLSVDGFVYVAGTLSIAGGGNAAIHGSAYLGDYSDLSGSHVTIWYDPVAAASVKTKNVSIVRTSWQEIGSCSWSTGNATCP